MLGVSYFKAEPTEFARMSSNGKIRKEGQGISGFYMPFKTSIELVSIASKDQPFAFSEISSNNQQISIQGGLVYRITEPVSAITKYNFSIDPQTKAYLSEDNVKLPEQIINTVRAGARKIVQATELEKLLVMNEELSGEVFESVSKSGPFSNLGVKVENIYITKIRPIPEISKALEATYRESLLQKADEAIYARRALAVEKERAIQENEMKTKIELEEKKKELVELEGKNIQREAEFKAEAARKELDLYSSMKPEYLAALGLYEIGKKAERIGNLTITPEIMASIMSGAGKR